MSDLWCSGYWLTCTPYSDAWHCILVMAFKKINKAPLFCDFYLSFRPDVCRNDFISKVTSTSFWQRSGPGCSSQRHFPPQLTLTQPAIVDNTISLKLFPLIKMFSTDLIISLLIGPTSRNTFEHWIDIQRKWVLAGFIQQFSAINHHRKTLKNNTNLGDFVRFLQVFIRFLSLQ